MKRKITLAIILASVLIGAIFIHFKSGNLTRLSDNKEIKFTGNITETNNGCWFDGICSIKVDERLVTAEIGGLGPPNSKPEIRGKLIGISFSQDTQKYIGKKVEVYAKQTNDNGFTIYGNENYYIRLLE